MNTHALSHQSWSWQTLSDRLGGRSSVKLANNTTLFRGVLGSMAIMLHATVIVRFLSPHGTSVGECIILNSGGYRTHTTKDRMNSFLPIRWRVYQKDFLWYVSDRYGDTVRFTDGMTLVEDTP